MADDRFIIEMGHSSVGVSKENLIASVEAKGKAMEAIYEGKFHEAIKYLNQAILLNPSSAIMYATRAAVYHKMKKAKAAILNANTALQINPKSSRGNKYREMALPMLGVWEKAARMILTQLKQVAHKDACF